MVAELPSSSAFGLAMACFLAVLYMVTFNFGDFNYELDRYQQEMAPCKFGRLVTICEESQWQLPVVNQTYGAKGNYILDEPNVQFMAWNGSDYASNYASQDYISNYDLDYEYNLDMNEKVDFNGSWIGASLEQVSWIGADFKENISWIGTSWADDRWIGAAYEESYIEFYGMVNLSSLVYASNFIVDYDIKNIIGGLWWLLASMLGVMAISLRMSWQSLRRTSTRETTAKSATSHLSRLRRNRKWNGTLRNRWESKMRLRSLICLFAFVQTEAMNVEQAKELLTRMVDLSAAATTAAQISTNVLKKFEEGQENKNKFGKFGDGAKVLRSPDVFDTDDPVRYSLWREQVLNWLTFCDSRYADLVKDVEELDTGTDMESMTDEVKELSTKLYSILSSYLKGPALQVVRSNMGTRNGFGVWSSLKSLYAPRARPRALAIGQAIMQHPSFSQQRSMLENLLQFDQFLDQYELASGAKMPDDIAVSTVLRCVDTQTRRHLEMVMDDKMDYRSLKDKLILLDKNTRAWSGDNFLKNFQQAQALQGQPSSSSNSNYQGPQRALRQQR